MAFLDFLTGKIKCPRCGAGGAKEEGGQILCPNPSCAYFVGSRGGGQSRAAAPTSGSTAASGGFAPARTLTIRYRNFKGEEKEFAADADTAKRFKKHISVCIGPKGYRIVLARDRITNWNEVDESLPQRVAPGQDLPSARERQVLGYHKKYKSTSPLYEKVRAKYPHW